MGRQANDRNSIRENKKSVEGRSPDDPVMTYRELYEKTGITPQHLHKIEGDSLNKMISAMADKYTFHDAILLIAQILNIDPGYLIKKLDTDNKKLLHAYKIQDR